MLIALLAAQAKHGAAAPVVPLVESPLEALRRRRAERQAGGPAS